ncbi:response regulator transcription factor [Pacificispira sp.]|uniref:response regulator transcription factor n=1 Tax=Pacificispira sp. TaxID=2888761 RepID=UPI003BAD835E
MKCRVLIVDDNAPVKMLFRELLLKEGVASISEAENGVEGLPHLEARPAKGADTWDL